MDNWIILSKLITLVYLVFKFAGGETGSTTEIVLTTLIYMCLNMLIHIFKHGKFKSNLMIISMLLLLSSSYYIHALFILLVPINIYELVLMFNESLYLPVLIAAIPLALLDKNMFTEYFLIGSFSYTVYLSSQKYFGRIKVLSNENDEMREKIHLLSGKLDKDIEYERQMKYTSQLEERNKIAQEIHDRLGHAIAGSLMQLEAANLLLDKDRNKTQEMIQNVINVLRDGMESIRFTLRNIKPAAEQLGINRLKLLLDEFSASNNVRITLLHTGNLERISHLQWKVIHDNMNEGLTNVLKYAGATTVSVNIEVLNKFIKAEIKDNGIGAYKIKKGLGIRGMEERSESIGGKVIVDGTKGFSIITLLPLEE